MMREKLRTLIRGAYQVQRLRIQMGNRIAGNFKAKLGQEPGQKEDELTAEARALLDDLRAQFRRITDGITRRRGVIAELPTEFEPQPLITTFTELALIAQYDELLRQETAHFKRVGKVVEDFPLWDAFLKEVRGVGPAMAGVILSEIDIHRCKYASSIWKYAGLDVCSDGRGRSRRDEHCVQRDYVDKDGATKQRKSITFNPWLKTKMIGVLATSFLRAGGDDGYKTFYYDYKHRLENMPAHAEKTKGHRHNMAMRYMVKRFLADLYEKWRPLEGLPVYDDYARGKLGIKHGKEEAIC